MWIIIIYQIIVAILIDASMALAFEKLFELNVIIGFILAYIISSIPSVIFILISYGFAFYGAVEVIGVPFIVAFVVFFGIFFLGIYFSKKRNL